SRVRIIGSNFTPSTTVTAGGVAGSVVPFDDPTAPSTASTLTVDLGAHAAGLVDVTVTNGNGESATLPSSFRYIDPPVVQGAVPASGPTSGNTVVTLNGSNFQANAVVTINGVPATNVTLLDVFTLRVTTPAGNPGLAKVAVTNPDGGTGSNQVFTY